MCRTRQLQAGSHSSNSADSAASIGMAAGAGWQLLCVDSNSVYVCDRIQPRLLSPMQMYQKPQLQQSSADSAGWGGRSAAIVGWQLLFLCTQIWPRVSCVSFFLCSSACRQLAVSKQAHYHNSTV
jgi:hypothetical protein